MPPVRSQHHITDQLTRAFDAIATDTVLLHSDIAPVEYVPEPFSRRNVLDGLLQALITAAEGRTLMMPAFNYSFPATRLYNVQDDPAQVGVLNEHFRTAFPTLRTRTPVFNVCMNRPDERYPREPVQNVLGTQSVFARLVSSAGTVAFLGTDLRANTLFHHVEEIADVPYRYVKRFDGVVRPGGTAPDQAITIDYRVRPRADGAALIDTHRLQDDLASVGLLARHPVGNGWLTAFRADRAVAYWRERLTDDPHYFLTPQARAVAGDLYRTFGRPLTHDNVEG